MGDIGVQLSTPAQLDKIDKLRELGVAEYIALPQLVVVGDQSSGKSSVLEAISQLPFPRDSGLCTRFATNITFRRANHVNISISVIPASTSDTERVEKFRAFKKDGLTSLTGPKFLEILQEATKLMGISEPGECTTSDKTTFSSDVFKVELSGPTHENLSIIDIPGIFRTPTPNVTTKADMGMVKDMVRNYIRDERTIILAVIAANVDIATQEILTMAEEVDPYGHRTLGVLTKPDLVDEGGESHVIDLVMGKRKPLKLGYCMVRNRGQKELSSDSSERHRKETEFFRQPPWSTLEKDRVGITALKDRLQDLLADITRREMPKVKAQLEKRLIESKRKLESLGADRTTREAQQGYLQRMADSFQKVVSEALDAYYARNEVFNTIPELRLATISVDLNEKYADAIRKWGHTVKFAKTGDSTEDDMTEGNDPAFQDAENHNSGLLAKFSLEAIKNCAELDYPELLNVLPSGFIKRVCENVDSYEWIEGKYRDFRGQGLMTINPAVLPSLWKEQTQNWTAITMEYIRCVIYHVHDFMNKLLGYVCPDEHVRGSLWQILEEKLFEKYQKAVTHAYFLLSVERGGTLLTTNHYFNSNIQKYRNERLSKRIKQYIGQDTSTMPAPAPAPSGFQFGAASFPSQPNPFNSVSPNVGNPTIRLSQVLDVVAMGNTEYAIREIDDILRSYYKVVQKRMVDAVCMQASDHHLLSGDESPLRVFSTQMISELSEEQLEQIAGEETFSKRQRKELRVEISKLEDGRKVLRS